MPTPLVFSPLIPLGNNFVDYTCVVVYEIPICCLLKTNLSTNLVKHDSIPYFIPSIFTSDLVIALKVEHRVTDLNQQRDKWKTYGCIIISYGWIGPTKLSIINFMVYLKGSMVFLNLVNVSNNIKDHKYIYKLLKIVTKEVRVENVVQIIIDNGSTFIKVGKLLMKKFNLY